jgi:hypothetical protein
MIAAFGDRNAGATVIADRAVGERREFVADRGDY